MTLHAEFAAPESRLWGTWLTEIDHDFYHLPGYAWLSVLQEQGDPGAFLATEGRRRLFVPLIIRPIRPPAGVEGGPFFDASSPYGYAGPLLSPGPPGEEGGFLGRAVDAFLAEMRRRRIVSVFLRLHPLFNLPEGPLRDSGILVQHGETVSVDLTSSLEEMWRQTRANHRRNIKRAAREGQVARMDEKWSHFDDFIELYHETMTRLEADTFYFFPREYFVRLREVLGDRLHLCVVEIGGHVVSSALLVETCGIVQYHLGGTRDAYLSRHPLKTILHFARGWAKGRGNRLLHLGGGLGGRKDSLFEFKAGFSHARHPFFTWRLVVDDSAYRRLVRGWTALSGEAPDEVSGFFPAYRKRYEVTGSVTASL